MARKKRKTRLRPKVPKRVKTRKGPRRQRSHHHPELIGLGLAALGVFLGSILYAGWDGGIVGGAVADGFLEAFGAAAYGAPPALTGVGTLMVVRSELVDVRPFRTGVPVLFAGLLLTLGRDHGGYAGRAGEATFGYLLGHTGTAILGATTLAVGAVLLTGASLGALVRRAAQHARRILRAPSTPEDLFARAAARARPRSALPSGGPGSRHPIARPD